MPWEHDSPGEFADFGEARDWMVRSHSMRNRWRSLTGPERVSWIRRLEFVDTLGMKRQRAADYCTIFELPAGSGSTSCMIWLGALHVLDRRWASCHGEGEVRIVG
jgi:hypothetical protein